MLFAQPDPEPGIAWITPRSVVQLCYFLDRCHIPASLPARQATIRLHCAGIWASYERVAAAQRARAAPPHRTDPAAAATRPVDWQEWRACPICRAQLGKPCRALSGRIVDGRTDGIAVTPDVPHHARQRRTKGG